MQFYQNFNLNPTFVFSTLPTSLLCSKIISWVWCKTVELVIGGNQADLIWILTNKKYTINQSIATIGKILFIYCSLIFYCSPLNGRSNVTTARWSPRPWARGKEPNFTAFPIQWWIFRKSENSPVEFLTIHNQPQWLSWLKDINLSSP